MSKVKKDFHKLQANYEKQKELKEKIEDDSLSLERCKKLPEYIKLKEDYEKLSERLKREVLTFIEESYEYQVHTYTFLGFKISHPKIYLEFVDGKIVFCCSKLDNDEEDILKMKLTCFTGVKARPLNSFAKHYFFDR